MREEKNQTSCSSSRAQHSSELADAALHVLGARSRDISLGVISAKDGSVVKLNQEVTFGLFGIVDARQCAEVADVAYATGRGREALPGGTEAIC